MNDADLGNNIDDYTQDVDGQRSKGDADRQSVIGADPANHLDPRLVQLKFLPPRLVYWAPSWRLFRHL